MVDVGVEGSLAPRHSFIKWSLTLKSDLYSQQIYGIITNKWTQNKSKQRLSGGDILVKKNKIKVITINYLDFWNLYLKQEQNREKKNQFCHAMYVLSSGEQERTLC